MREQLAFWPSLDLAYGSDQEPHGLPLPSGVAAERRYSDHKLLHWPVGRPHLLEVIKLTHLGAKDVDDDVAGVDEHPIAMGLPFDAGAAIAFIFELPDEL